MKLAGVFLGLHVEVPHGDDLVALKLGRGLHEQLVEPQLTLVVIGDLVAKAGLVVDDAHRLCRIINEQQVKVAKEWGSRSG